MPQHFALSIPMRVAGAAMGLAVTTAGGLVADAGEVQLFVMADDAVLDRTQTPHLGASTAEAQESVGIEIAHSIRAALLEGTIRNAVNMPNLDAKTLAIIGPHLRFGEKLGKFLSQIAPKRAESLNINYSGKVNEADTKEIVKSRETSVRTRG